MSSAFRLQPDDGGWGRAHFQDLDASHECYLAGVECDACGATWAMTGVQYPSLCCSEVRRAAGSLPRGVVHVDEYLKMARRISPLSKARPLWPGTSFGPIRGTLRGKLSDFSWVNPWTPLIALSALRRLEQKIGFAVSGATAEIKIPRNVDDELFEPEAVPTIVSTHSNELQRCAKCGRAGGRVPDDISIKADSLVSTAFVQRMCDYTTVIIVREKVANAIMDLKLSNVSLKPVRVT